mmetsp:Transcript_40065/g.118915  ORF Transcript_40065/g.118915 Transcript_40065/m.118915 type:complete len:211 (-) Transcript_40065:95-727(-)
MYGVGDEHPVDKWEQKARERRALHPARPACHGADEGGNRARPVRRGRLRRGRSGKLAPQHLRQIPPQLRLDGRQRRRLGHRLAIEAGEHVRTLQRAFARLLGRKRARPAGLRQRFGLEAWQTAQCRRRKLRVLHVNGMEERSHVAAACVLEEPAAARVLVRIARQIVPCAVDPQRQRCGADTLTLAGASRARLGAGGRLGEGNHAQAGGG